MIRETVDGKTVGEEIYEENNDTSFKSPSVRGKANNKNSTYVM